jgi:hypothetical protein
MDHHALALFGDDEIGAHNAERDGSSATSMARYEQG